MMNHLSVLVWWRKAHPEHRNDLMKEFCRERLTRVIDTTFEVVCERGNKILVHTLPRVKRGDAFAEASWNRYFSDLSSGSYTPLRRSQGAVARDRAWHFAFKNLHVFERIRRDSRARINILDVGCATGYFRRFLEGNLAPDRRNTVFYWGVDIRSSVLRTAICDPDCINSGASGNISPSAFVLHDAGGSLPFHSDTFDYVINFEMLKYLPVPQGRALLQETARVMNPDGTFVLSAPTSYEYYREVKPDYMISLSPNELTDALSDVRLDVEAIYGTQGSHRVYEAAVASDHEAVFSALSRYHPPEILAAIFAPLYPEYSTQISLVCQCRT